jgi:hypothetical protein
MAEHALVRRRSGRARVVGVAAAVALAVALVAVVAVAVPAPAARAVPAQSGTTRPGAPRSTVTLPDPDPEPTPEEARRQADDILARSEYQPPPPSPFERVLRWIGDRLEDLLGRVPAPQGPGAAPAAGTPILPWIVIGLLVALAVFLVWRWRGSAMPVRRRRDETDPLAVSESQARRAPDEWLAEAERLEARQQWKAALRCRFRALVGELIERGVVRDLPGRTSGEFRIEVRRSSRAVAPPFAEAANLFDAAWYGDAPTGPAESQAFQRLAGEVLAASPLRDRGPSDAGADGGPGADGDLVVTEAGAPAGGGAR